MGRLVKSGEFASLGEQLTAAVLERDLPDDWVIIANRELPGRETAREIDFVVVAPNHVFLLEDKYWSDLIQGNDYAWVLSSGETTRSPIQKVEEASKKFSSLMEAAAPGIMNRWRGKRLVQGFVVLSHATAQPDISDPRAQSRVIKLGEIVQRLLKADRQGGETLGGDREQILKRLLDLPGRPEVPSQIADYRVIEVLEVLPTSWLLRAQHEDGTERTLRLIPKLATALPDRAEETRNARMREYDTLKRLGELHLAPEVEPYFTWGIDDYWVVPMRPLLGQTLRAANFVRQPSQQEAVGGTVAAYESLRRVHEEGVVHRALSPDRVHLLASGAVAFSGFVAARLVGAATIASRVGGLVESSGYIAPEARTDPSFAGPPADVYGLAASLFMWITGYDFDDPVEEPPRLDELRDDLANSNGSVMTGLFAQALGEDPLHRPTPEEISLGLISE